MRCPPERDTTPRIVIVGAGPAGLTAAQQLAERGVRPTVVDRDCRVGGLSQTLEYKGYRFDIGGHRFYTKVPGVERLWRDMLGADFLRRPRLSRIYYQRRMFHYPLKPLNALWNLGIGTAVAVVASYVRSKLTPVAPEVTFEDWVVNRFGRRLYRIFFETYTKKVWGIEGSSIRAQWAAQRIKGLSLKAACAEMLASALKPRRRTSVKTLIAEFEYPRLGPGMMWEAFSRRVETAGGQVLLNSPVVGIEHDGQTVRSVVIERNGQRETLPADQVISSMPIRDLLNAWTPPPPPEVLAAARRLNYRDFISVAIIIDTPDLFPDNWIYIHDPSVHVGRIQNYKNWSPDMVPEPGRTCLGLEYFCSEGDELWNMSDDALLALARRELQQLGLANLEQMLDGTVVRMLKAYPVYDEGFEQALATVRAYVGSFANLQLIGRNGTHKYNNQDHSMVSAMLAVRNLYGERNDLWALNADDEYYEQGTPPDPAAAADGVTDHIRDLQQTQPAVPVAVPVSFASRRTST